ncbi:hypothetical protein R6Q59_028660 [Mikania micrantha]
MQVLENLLHIKNCVYYTRENFETNVVEDIFFCHKKSYTWWCAFPHVLMIDAAYKSNMPIYTTAIHTDVVVSA